MLMAFLSELTEENTEAGDQEGEAGESKEKQDSEPETTSAA
jgi:hypothetical protein